MAFDPIATPNSPNVGDHRLNSYLPHQGFIGNQALEVPNYLFTNTARDGRQGYAHCQGLTRLILSRSVEDQYKKSRALTEFLRRREMTFSKLTKSGQYRIFSVPCTTTPVPVPKSLFNALEQSAQILVASLRFVLQDIYGSQDVRSSAFVKSLPPTERRQFIEAVEDCPNYFPQLHHPVMRDYPFFDVVGLDLVLTEDYTEALQRRPRLVNPEEGITGQQLPFRLLELNAGSPSGASNNLHMLDGLSQIDPEVLHTMERVIPNDHFEVLGATYRALGQAWTGCPDGVQIVLPPGGENGAAPEIHQLAAYSGLVYADAGQLYRDEAGMIRLRTVSGQDPVVTAIYSRVNADSALFDKDRGVTLRDAETGKPLYWMDPLTSGRKARPLRNSRGQPIPLESNYAIPGAIEAIHSRKLYMGGLNRVLDNKMILSTLAEHAPVFFRTRLKALGLDPERTRTVSPPETLPSTAESVALIARKPEDWVIKTPNLSGGKGVYILKTLPEAERRKILTKAKADPQAYAYQRLVRIGRIPVAVREKDASARYANIAADLRMWMFFGDGEGSRLPRLTHNALIRMAPQEKGPLSSIVNTSMGGGYSSMVVVDDVGHPDAISIEKLVQPRPPAALACDLPSFAGAQLVQVANLVDALRTVLEIRAIEGAETGEGGRSVRSSGSADAYQSYLFAVNLKKQCREIISFLHPRNMEPVNEILSILEKRVDRKRVEAFFSARSRAQVQVVTALQELESVLSAGFFDQLEQLRVLNVEPADANLTVEERKADRGLLRRLRGETVVAAPQVPALERLFTALERLVALRHDSRELSLATRKTLLWQLELFRVHARAHLVRSERSRAFGDFFIGDRKRSPIEFNILFTELIAPRKPSESLIRSVHSHIATEEELRNEKLLLDTDIISDDLRAARKDWLRIMREAEAVPEERRTRFLETARRDHFDKHKFLREYQELLSSPTVSGPKAILKILEILPYARYNVLQFARQQGLPMERLFEEKLADRRIALLTRVERQANELNDQNFAGECFARKRSKHGLFSDSQIYLWVASELNPFIQAYTIGHELVHFQQIRAMIELEQKALRKGPASFAKFLNFFGNFLGLTYGALEDPSTDVTSVRRPVFGFAELMGVCRGHTWVSRLTQALKEGPLSWNDVVEDYGSLLGFSTDVSVQVKVKAIREVIPALENAKNIRFAKELGLEVHLDEIRSALPAANDEQVARYRDLVNAAASSPELNWEALRVIASHQYAGVRFPRQVDPARNLVLKAPLFAIALGGSYNQTQQQ